MENTASDLLFSSGVLEERDGDVFLSDPFESSVGEYQETIAGYSRDELSDLLRNELGEDSVIDPFVRLEEKEPRVVAELLALHDSLEASTGAERLKLLPVLRLFRRESVPTDGVPEPFVPIPGNLLPEFSELYSHLFVYVWLDDCEPCDALKPRLESLFDRPREVMPFAVYGPKYQDTLAREYDVTAGPAMLFLRAGTVDTRLYGAHSETIIETELEKLRE